MAFNCVISSGLNRWTASGLSAFSKRWIQIHLP